MAKNWVTIETVNNIPKENISNNNKKKREASFRILIDNSKSLSIPEMKKRSQKLYEIEKAKEDNLLEAFNDKRLKSKNLIQQALRIKKERAAFIEKNKSAKQNKKEVSNNEATEKAV